MAGKGRSTCCSTSRGPEGRLAQISILQLVEQYLTYLAEARALKLEIAADYLVMAAWLAYLKSCLLLPKDPEQDPSPEEIAFRCRCGSSDSTPCERRAHGYSAAIASGATFS